MLPPTPSEPQSQRRFYLILAFGFLVVGAAAATVVAAAAGYYYYYSLQPPPEEAASDSSSSPPLISRASLQPTVEPTELPVEDIGLRLRTEQRLGGGDRYGGFVYLVLTRTGSSPLAIHAVTLNDREECRYVWAGKEGRQSGFANPPFESEWEPAPIAEGWRPRLGDNTEFMAGGFGAGAVLSGCGELLKATVETDRGTFEYSLN